MTTNKPTKKRMIYNVTIVERLQEKYGVSKRFITMSLSGDRVGETSSSVKEDYKKMLREMTNLLNSL